MQALLLVLLPVLVLRLIFRETARKQALNDQLEKAIDSRRNTSLARRVEGADPINRIAVRRVRPRQSDRHAILAEPFEQMHKPAVEPQNVCHPDIIGQVIRKGRAPVRIVECPV